MNLASVAGVDHPTRGLDPALGERRPVGDQADVPGRERDADSGFRDLALAGREGDVLEAVEIESRIARMGTRGKGRLGREAVYIDRIHKIQTLPKAILFDNDGVLVASEPLHWAAWERLFQELDLPYQEADLRAMVGTTAPEILLRLLNRHRPGWNPEELDLAALAQRKNDFYLALAQKQLGPYPGVREGLEWARGCGIRTAVVSNARRREVESAVTIAGLRGLLEAIVSRDDVAQPKPAPDMYLFAAASLGTDPADCVAVEDSPTGLEAALMAAIPATAVLTNFSRDAVESPVPGRPDLRPAWVVQDMAEFFGKLRSLSRGFDPLGPADTPNSQAVPKK